MMLAIGLLLYGCSWQESKIEALEPISKEALLARLQEKQINLTEFAAKGSATVNFFAENRTESMNNVTIYFADEQNMMMRIGYAFGTAVSLGINPDEFWFWLNFGKTNDYYSGSARNLQNCGAAGIKTFPATEALGIVDIESLKEGRLTFNGDEYAIELTDANDQPERCYYFDKTANLIRIIHYEQLLAKLVAEFGDYKPATSNLSLPTKISILAIDDNMRLDLRVSRFMEFSLDSRRREKLFTPPKPSREANKFYLGQDCQFQLQ